MSRTWTGDGSVYSIEWGGKAWSLDVGGDTPGLRIAGEPGVHLLALAGVADVGRFDRGAFCGATLQGVERRFDRVEATYRPLDWGGMLVRATWRPSGAEGIDLEVHLQADSVDLLNAVEVMIESRFGSVEAQPAALWIEPREDANASLSLDGREDRGTSVTSGPPIGKGVPRPCVRSTALGTYLEFCHSDDLSRRVFGDPAGPEGIGPVRYALFGHHLEKGVVLRGRLRGIFRARGVDSPSIDDLQASFLHEPLPLGT